MNEALEKIKEDLLYAQDGAKAMHDYEGAFRISRAIAALEADPNEPIFTKEFEESYVYAKLMNDK